MQLDLDEYMEIEPGARCRGRQFMNEVLLKGKFSLFHRFTPLPMATEYVSERWVVAATVQGMPGFEFEVACTADRSVAESALANTLNVQRSLRAEHRAEELKRQRETKKRIAKLLAMTDEELEAFYKREQQEFEARMQEHERDLAKYKRFLSTRQPATE